MPLPSDSSKRPPASAVPRRDLLRLGAGALTLGVLPSVLGASPAHASGERRADPGLRALQREVAGAAAEFGFPANLLMAVAWVNTRGRMPSPDESAYEPGSLSGRGSYGPAALERNPFVDTVGRAARLTGLPASRLMTDRRANLRGGAALLAELRRRAGAASLLDVVAAGDPAYAQQLRQALATRAWSRPQPSVPDRTGGSQTTVTTKPSVVWYPAHANNYTAASRPTSHPIRTIVIHVTQGSWSSALNWFQNPDAGVSAHYTVRSSDGRIGQSVSDANIAYHAGNWTVNQTSIGIEHEGYVDDPGWFTSALYDGSARMAAYLCRRYGIPIDRSHIIGHNEVPGASHTDPGPWWWWNHYMDRVRSYAA